MNTLRVARELALLTLSQTTPPITSLGDFLGRAAARLAEEAREHLTSASALLARTHDLFARLDQEFGPELLQEIVRASVRLGSVEQLNEVALEKVAQTFWRRAQEDGVLAELQAGTAELLVPEALRGIEELQEAADLLASALDWPAIAAMAGSEEVQRFALKLVEQYVAHHGEVDRALDDAAANWSIERMASMDRDVLRLAIAELQHAPEVPVEVVINEAVELAKKYGTDDSGKFVNGVLSAFAADAAKIRS